MARSRNIKPGFFINEDLAELSFEYRLLFIGLWTLADKEGRLENRPKRIKMSIFPADDVNVTEGLALLNRYGFVILYERNGCNYVQISNWHKHQSPHHTEKQSLIPAPLSHESITVESRNDLRGNPPDSLIPDSLIPDSKTPIQVGAITTGGGLGGAINPETGEIETPFDNIIALAGRVSA